MDIRPRTLGEILDDGWRLAFADAPLLLLFNALFLVPAFLALLLLLALPSASGMGQFVLPALAALLVPLTGLASGACQELLRQRLANPPSEPRTQRSGVSGSHLAAYSAALRARLGWRHSVEHAAARALLLCGTLPGPLLLVVTFLPDTSPILRFLGFLFGLLLTFLLSLPLWGACFSLHILLSADAGRSGTLLSELRRDAAAAPGKAAVLVLSRVPLLFFLALQLHLLAKVVLWAADNLGGLDTSLLAVQLSFFSNPLYTLALFLLSWLLLTPFFECSNFLLHTDIRTRQEGLDLQHRVQRAFAGESSELRASAGGRIRSLMLAVLIFFPAGAAPAEEVQRDTIRSVRQELETVRSEIQKAEPYPGGRRWQGRLEALQAKLARSSGGEPRRFRWFEQAIVDFPERKKEDALRILDDLHRRLTLLEDSLAAPDRPAAPAKEKRSPQDIKSLLRGSEGRKVERNRTRQRVEEERPEVRREERQAKERQGEAPQEGGGRNAPVSVPAGRGGGFSSLGWLLLGGLALAVVSVGIFLYLSSPRSPKRTRDKPAEQIIGAVPDNDTRQVLEESPAALWRQADALAGEQRFRDAVRTLYLAVLALLHRQHFIRFEPTRTNGEYIRQVRLSELAPSELHEPFQRLTQQFEMAWYGERPCESSDYRSCRDLAEEVQRLSHKS